MGDNGDSTGALSGVRVLDCGLLVQAPQCALTLHDMGADVIKVELPMMGDQARWIPISADDRRGPYFEGCNRGKRSITIDLRTPEGQAVFMDLAKTADVVVSNFKPGTMEQWGLGYEDLAAVNPRIVYAAGSVFGPEGPAAEREGADLAGQAAGGLISTTGVDGGDPTPVGVTIADHIASQNMTAGVLAALLARERTGRGQRVDVSLFGGQLYAQASEYAYYFLSGELPGRSNRGHPLLHAAYGIVPTADGWLAIVGVPPAQRAAFWNAVERPDMLDDERFAPLLYTAETKKALFDILVQEFPKRTTADWSERLSAAGCRFAPVNDYAAAVADPHAAANGYVIEGMNMNGEPARTIGSPIQMSDTPTAPALDAPELGQHTEEILLELGYDWERIGELHNANAI
jgi:crotonobetainyl-CoA:carnitine CoA-transferase CaiB-like acyl-CoA transferase